jgi:hypothetical protein
MTIRKRTMNRKPKTVESPQPDARKDEEELNEEGTEGECSRTENKQP